MSFNFSTVLATDLFEAFEAGKQAVEFAKNGSCGEMVTTTRIQNEPYAVGYGRVSVEEVAGRVKKCQYTR